MKHYGDITKLNGAELPVVDVITGGSPCQDLSVAGKREGLAGERSGLFMEQIRIVKEMRERDIRSGRTSFDARPRFMVWENVPGAFSSNKGKDFQAVLTEIIRVADAEAPDVPMPDGGKWRHAGCLYDYLGRWSVAWRVHDAQFWGVPQRRKRIALVADFGGMSAPEILFERESVSGDTESCGTPGEETAGSIREGVAATITATYGTKWNGNAGAYNGENFVIEDSANQSIAGTLDANYYKGCGERQGVERTVILNDQGGSMMSVTHDKTAALRAQEHGHQPVISFNSKQVSLDTAKEIDATLGASDYKEPQSVCYGLEPGAAARLNTEGRITEELSPTLRSNAGDNQASVVYGISAYESNDMKSSNPNSGVYQADTARTLDNNGGNPACNQGGMAVVAFTNQGAKAGSVAASQTTSPPIKSDAGGNTVPIVAIEGNGSRPSHQGDGYAETETMYTLNSTEKHAVCFEPRTPDGVARVVDGDLSPTLNTMGGGATTTVRSSER